MYEGFYGLSIKPFSMMPDPGFLYLSKKHQAALTLLEYGLMNNVGFCVISGEIGAGKTTLLRKLLERVDNSYTVGMITNTHQSFGSLLDWVLSAFNQHDTSLSQVEKHQKLIDFLIAEYAKNKKVLLIVDEAQNMKADALEELRMLSNVNSEKDMLMQVILAGQPALKGTLRLPELGQFAQRIGVDYHLDALGAKETCHYIQHRLRTAGARQDIFTPAACERIYNYSGGTPRLINLLCDTVMVYGYADQSLVIDADLVNEMVHERMRDSVVPLVNRDVSAEVNQELLAELARDFPHIRPDDEAVVEEDDAIATENTVEEDNRQKGDSNHVPQATNKSSSDETKASKPQPLLNPVEVIAPQTKPASSSRFGLYAIILGLVILVVFFLYRSNILKTSSSDHSGTKNTDNTQQIEKAHQAAQAMEQEQQRLVKQAETLRHERDKAIARMQQEKQRAEKAALEANKAMKAAALVKQREAKKLAAKARQHERQLQAQARREKQRMLKQQRLTRQAEKKAREEAVTAKKHAAELIRQQRILEAKLKQQQYQKQQDANQRMEAEKQAARSAVPVTAKPEEKTIKFDDGCTGPAARFKSTCR